VEIVGSKHEPSNERAIECREGLFDLWRIPFNEEAKSPFADPIRVKTILHRT